jgi:hypothetical protein
MSELLASICVFGLVLGTLALTILGLWAITHHRPFRLRLGRGKVDLHIGPCGPTGHAPVRKESRAFRRRAAERQSTVG